MIGLTSVVTLVLEPELIEKHANSRKALGIDEEGGEFLARFVAVLLQQLMEKIDQVREIAGRQLQRFFKFVAPHTIDFS